MGLREMTLARTPNLGWSMAKYWAFGSKEWFTYLEQKQDWLRPFVDLKSNYSSSLHQCVLGFLSFLFIHWSIYRQISIFSLLTKSKTSNYLLQICPFSPNKPWTDFVMVVVYFDQLSGAARIQKRVETLFSAVFDIFCLKWTNGWKQLKRAEKMFQPAFRCAQHPKAGRNTQHT